MSKLKVYNFEETFLYEVVAESAEKARAQFDEYMSTGDEFETDTKFCDNSLEIYDSKGNRVVE